MPIITFVILAYKHHIIILTRQYI